MSSSIETTLSTRSQAAATKTQRIVILISGRGSNMQSIVRMAQARRDMEVVAVIANRADSAGLLWPDLCVF